MCVVAREGITLGTILGLAYTYDANGNITSIVDTLNPPGPGPVETSATYAYDEYSNKLLHITGTPSEDFVYDPNGNTTSENTRSYVYDLSNQLVRVLDNGIQIAAYTFNGVGQRIKKVTTGTRVFHYDPQDHLIAETDGGGAMIAEYVYLNDRLLAMIAPGGFIYYYHNDHLGTPLILTDGSANVAWKAKYTPFGQAQISVQNVVNPFRLPGQYYDTETGLNYNYYRTYHPNLGRYVTPDPIGLEGGINLFGYVGNNPVNRVDREGTAFWIPFISGAYATYKGVDAYTAKRLEQAKLDALLSYINYLDRQLDKTGPCEFERQNYLEAQRRLAVVEVGALLVKNGMELEAWMAEKGMSQRAR